jgi:hypothetical protein
MSPFGVIDFVDNQCGAAPAPLAASGVVGGPPAYLDAHGIRYVPTAALESPEECADDPQQLVSMARGAAPESAPVSHQELNSRVDDRIRRFMSQKADLSSLREDIRASRLRADERLAGLRGDHGLQTMRGESGLQTMRGESGLQTMRSESGTRGDRGLQGLRENDDLYSRRGDDALLRRSAREMDDEDRRRRISEIRAARGRSYDDSDARYESRARSYDDDRYQRRADDDGELRALYKQMQADVARARDASLSGPAAAGLKRGAAAARTVPAPTAAAPAKMRAGPGAVKSVPGSRVLSQAAAARVGKARDELRRAGAIDF